jgi:hypothetical protein
MGWSSHRLFVRANVHRFKDRVNSTGDEGVFLQQALKGFPSTGIEGLSFNRH